MKVGLGFEICCASEFDLLLTRGLVFLVAVQIALFLHAEITNFKVWTKTVGRFLSPKIRKQIAIFEDYTIFR